MWAAGIVRIVFILSGLGAGGAEKVVNLLAHHRRAQGDIVHVIATNSENPRSYFPYDQSIQVEAIGRLQENSGIRATLGKLLRLRRRLREISPDLVISFLTKVNVLAGLATMGLGTATIMSERNNFRLQSMNLVWRSIAPVTAHRAAALVMQTDFARSLLPKPLRSRAVVIPNPVALSGKPVRAPGDGARFVAVGRLDKQKGFDLLLEAFPDVAKRVPSATLSIFGEGPERSSLEQQVRKLEIADRVRMPGITTSPGEWLAAGDVFVLSSRFEGFPNVLLEALMAGLATVAFDCPWGPAEILHGDDVGLLVPASDVGLLAKALVRVATDQVLREKLAASGPRVAARYAKPVVFAQWDDVIADATVGRPIGLAAAS